jgi:hypothetical protein
MLTLLNRTVTAPVRFADRTPPYGGSGYEKPQSGYALCAVFLRHIWGKGRVPKVRRFATPYNLPQTSVTAKTLYEIWAGIDRKYIDIYKEIYECKVGVFYE